jgi:hypothetical protein
MVRTAFCLVILSISFTIPNINILLTIAGSVLGTIMTIVLPILFYNRAYSNIEKDKSLSLELPANA